LLQAWNLGERCGLKTEEDQVIIKLAKGFRFDTFPPVSADTVSLGIQVNWHAFVTVIFTQQRQRGAC